MCFSDHYVEDISQQVDKYIVAGVECVTVNIIWRIIHSQ
jgi:hypothetical protein